MTNLKNKRSEYRLGYDTLRELLGCGLGHIAVGVSALYENGFVPGELFDSKKLKACGLSDYEVKKIVRQCQGKDFKVPKQKDGKSKEPEKLSELDRYYIEHLREELIENSGKFSNLDIILRGMKPDEVPEQLIDRYMEAQPRKPREFPPPEPSAVKELFSKFTYENGSEPLDLSVRRSRGKPGAILRLSFPDELGQVVNILKPNEDQKHFDALRGKRTIKDLRDALHFVWFHSQSAERLGKGVPMVDLCDIQGDSHNTVRARNKRNGIKPEHNFFNRSVNWYEFNVMSKWHRGDVHLELDLSQHQSTEIVNDALHKQFVCRYPLNHAGIAMARKDWERAGRPNDFYECLTIRGYKANSYILPDNMASQ